MTKVPHENRATLKNMFVSSGAGDNEKGCRDFFFFPLILFSLFREWSSITAGGGTTRWEAGCGGQVKFYPYKEKGGGG